MSVILDGALIENNTGAQLPFNNRGTYYGDSIFETIRCHQGKPLLFEAHYFRLMAGMRVLRMEIPDDFTPEYLEEQMEKLLVKNNCGAHSRLRFTVWRKTGGYYTPKDNSIHYSMECSALENTFSLRQENEVELFKDHYVTTGMLGNLKTSNKYVNILAGIYGQENEYHDMLLLNNNKMVSESIAGNLFLVSGSTVKTPPLSDGCLNGIMRQQVIEQVKRMLNYKIDETSITPFELQRADELFTTNCIKGIQNITKFRKKSYGSALAEELIDLFNHKYFDE